MDDPHPRQHRSERPPPSSDHVVEGMTFRVRVSGEGTRPSRPTYLLIHGIGTSHRYLRRLARLLALGAVVATIDLPGFGGVPKARPAPGVSRMARGIGVVADRLGLAGVVALGHSMGSQWVVELGLQRPDLVRAVVVIGPVADDRHRTVLAQTWALARDIAGEPLDANAVVLMDYLRCGPAWFLAELQPMLTYPIEDRVIRLEAPLLVLRGGNDPIAGLGWCRRLRDRAPRGRLVIVPGHRHNAQFSAPRAVASAITAFVAREW